MRIYILLALIFLFQTGIAQELPRYSCLLDRADVELWINDTLHEFDDKGILIQGSNYHPVSICQYGLLCLDKFERTNDKKWLENAKHQVGYFLDTALVDNLFEGNGIGLPYNFSFKDLNAPWYSGMAQGMAVSFLLRYAEIVNDTSVYSACKKIAFVLTQPVEVGGCLSRTPENLLWIEEYPNSKLSPHVLNGALFGLFGLMDYCLVFPNQTREKRILADCIDALQSVLTVYDERNWTRYNRRNIYPNIFDYTHLQIFQMRQLFNYLQDPFYLRQACIWSAMTEGGFKQKQKKSFLFTDSDIGIPGKLATDSLYYEISSLETENEYEAERLNENGALPLPWYVFATSETVVLTEKKKLTISLDSTLTETHILFRYQWDKDLFVQEKWQASNGVSSSNHAFYLQPGTYQFAIFARPPKDGSTIDIYRFSLSDWIPD